MSIFAEIMMNGKHYLSFYKERENLNMDANGKLKCLKLKVNTNA